MERKNGSVEGKENFLEFVEENIKLLLETNRSFIICSEEGIPTVLVKKDEDGIWISLLSEL